MVIGEMTVIIRRRVKALSLITANPPIKGFDRSKDHVDAGGCFSRVDFMDFPEGLVLY